VKPYLKRQKNDAADAEAICEAVTRPTIRFVQVKSPEQQSVMMLHRVRLMLNHQRTQISNALRSHLSEFRVVAPIERNGIEQLLVIINDENDARIWERVQGVLTGRRATPIHSHGYEFAFTGLITCHHCGSAAEVKKGKYVYYHCTG
jgi:transposase